MGTKISIDTDTLAQMIMDVAQREVDKRVNPLRSMIKIQMFAVSALLIAGLILGTFFGHAEFFRLVGVCFFVLVGWMVPVWMKTDCPPVIVQARFILNEDCLEIIENSKSDLEK